jgi:hypothetical protein
MFPMGLRNGNQFSAVIPSSIKPGTTFFYHCDLHGSNGDCKSNGGGMTGLIKVVETIPFDFTLSTSPATQNITAGASGSFMVNLQLASGAPQAVNLAASVNPLNNSLTATLTPNTVTPNGSSTLTVNTTPDTIEGNFTIMITGTSGQILRNGSVTLNVTRPITPDFSIVSDTTTVSRGQSGQLTIKIMRVGGFSGNVTVAAPDTKAIKVKLTPSSQATTGSSVSFNFKVKKKAPIGTQMLIFTGKDVSGRARTGTLALVIK